MMIIQTAAFAAWVPAVAPPARSNAREAVAGTARFEARR